MEKKTTAAASALSSNSNGAVKDTIQEYFSEIEKAVKKETSGNANASHRQTSKKEEYEEISSNVYSFSSLIISGTED